MKIFKLLCEYRSNPLGIDIQHPRLSWQFQTIRRGAYQNAYRINVAEDIPSLLKQVNLLWDSGVVNSSASNLVPYCGQALRSRQRVYWNVRIWDEQDNPSEWSPPARFEMGLLRRVDWSGKWIASNQVGDSQNSAPCPYFRKAFFLDREIYSARLYITSLGLYQPHINGIRVSKDIFTPGWTNYHRRVQYQTNDVTQSLNQGSNIIGVILGDGWYCGHVAWEGRQNYGERPGLLAQLEIRFVDGILKTIGTDETWSTAFGPILGSDLIMGEDYDARLELDRWSFPVPDEVYRVGDERWTPVSIFSHPLDLELVAQNTPTIRVQGDIFPISEPVQLVEQEGEPWVFDFGQNLVGWVRLKIVGPQGVRITLRFGEMLSKDGKLYTDNLRSARQTDTYTLKGDPGGENFEPHFSFHGFRYVEVQGLKEPPTKDLLTAIVLHSDNTPALYFLCSQPLINQLQHNIEWGWKGNSLDVPTDCPQRDERLGWTGDAQVFVKTASYLTNSAGFFTKWIQDMADAQLESGAIPSFAPHVSSTHKADGGAAWSDAFIIVPWTIWQQYGDTRILKTHYNAMCSYMDYLVENSPGKIRLLPSKKELGPGFEEVVGGYGDWLAKDGSDDNLGLTPRELIGTAFLAYDACLMVQIAKALGKSADAAKFSRLFNDTQSAFQDQFIDQDGRIIGGTQTGYILALYFDLVPKDLREETFAALVEDIESRNIHMTTGFVGTPYLCKVLSDGGRLDLAYSLLLQTTYPSWLYSVIQGATTIWERWDGWTIEGGFQNPEMNSFNHYAYGAVGAWMVENVAGIRSDPTAPGFKHILLKPRIPPASLAVSGDGIEWANCEYRSPYGSIQSHWQIGDETLFWEVGVPPNTTATAWIPADENSLVYEGKVPVCQAVGITCLDRTDVFMVLTLQSGSYQFTVHQNTR